MKKIVILALVGLFAFGCVAIAEPAPASDNVCYELNTAGASGISPATKVVAVRYALSDPNTPSIASGDVLVWETTSGDGITISKALVNSWQSTRAGIAVTAIQSADNQSTARRNRNWGYMAVEGYCLAKVDTSESTVGGPLGISTSTEGYLDGNLTSGDIVLLSDTGVDGMMPIWLR